MSEIFPVFSYGSNSIFQLRGRVNNNNLLSYPGYINGYKRIFCCYSKRWKGAIASIVPQKYIKTYGIIVYLSKEELEILDGYEQNYSKIEIECNILDNIDNNNKILCYVYQSNNHEWIDYPSEQYLVAIKIMLDEHNLYESCCSRIIISKYNHTINRIENLSKWKFPIKSQLKLNSLFVIVNSKRNKSWKMPIDLNNIEERLQKLHVYTINDLEKYLNDDFYINMLGFKLSTLNILKKFLNE